MESIYWKRVVRGFCFCFFPWLRWCFFVTNDFDAWKFPLKINISPEKWCFVQMIHVLLKSMIHHIEPLFFAFRNDLCFFHSGNDSNWWIIWVLPFVGDIRVHFFLGGPGYQVELLVAFSQRHVSRVNDFRWRMSTSWQAKLRAVRVAPLSSGGPRTPALASGSVA